MNDWLTLRATIIEATSDIPGTALEDELRTSYANNPEAVEHAAAKVLTGYHAGKIRSPWGALKAETARAADPANNPTHDHGTTRAKAVMRAEQWLRIAGIHYDRETEIEDELYGERGILLAHPDTRQHILELWRTLRPQGEAIDAERAEFWERRRTQPKVETGGTVISMDDLRARARAAAADTTNLMHHTHP